MKIYNERETDRYFIFEIRPRQLFDLSRTNEHQQVHADQREIAIEAWNVQNHRMETFALAKNKRLEEYAKAMVLDAPDHPAFHKDEQALKQLQLT